MMTTTTSRRSFWPWRRRAPTHNVPPATSSAIAAAAPLYELGCCVGVAYKSRDAFWHDAPVDLVKTLFRA
jgi:hypothetical protein